MKSAKLLAAAVAGLVLAASPVFAQGADPLSPASPSKAPSKADPGKQPEKPTKQDQPKEDPAAKEKKEKENAKEKDKKDVDKAAKAVLGKPAPAFSGVDLDGKKHVLTEYLKEGKIVVLQWFNPECPFVVKHYGDKKTFNDLATKYKDKGVVFLAVNSGAPGKQGSGADLNKKYRKQWEINYPIILDEKGEIGRMFDAKRTPEMYIINKDGVLAYHGAIDDDSGGDKPGKTNYVEKALEELVAGSNVTTAQTRPYGCSVKY